MGPSSLQCWVLYESDVGGGGGGGGEGAVAYTCMDISHIHARVNNNAFHCMISCRLIKLSSPKLNYFIIVGAMLMYVSVYFYLLPVMDTIAVEARCIVSYQNAWYSM